MNLSRCIRLAFAAGCIAIAVSVSTAAVSTPTDAGGLLDQADRIKTSENARFVELMRHLDADPTALSRNQQDLLQYFHGWESAYQGDNEAAIRTWRTVAAHASDPNLRMRATSSLINVLANATRYEEAYELQEGLITALPDVRNPKTRLRILVNASLLYANAGQSDLALRYANQTLAETDGDFTTCQAQYLRMLTFSKMEGTDFETNYADALARCVKANEPLWVNSIRVFAARRDLDQGHPEAARAVLEPHLAEAQATRYQELLDEFEATLAQATWAQGDGRAARTHALRSIDGKADRDIVALAYGVLYEVAKKQGDAAAALDWHEKYATADKGYLNDVSARTLSYQMVRQQVQAKKLQIDALNKQNQVLQLKQAVSAKTVEASRLTLLLLLTLLGSIAVWAYRTKRSQLKFMQLSRRDGLTGISNRQYFVDTAEIALSLCKKSSQDACVVVFDLDHFKAVNDAHGHAMGDLVLKCAVSACEAHLRAHDLFGRTGGEEFAILMPDCIATTATKIAEKVRNAIAECHGTVGELTLPVHASFGIAASRTSGYELRQLLAHADVALYQAKREGRNCVVVHDHTKTDIDGLAAGTVDRRRM